MNETRLPKVSVGLMVIKEGKVLLGKRRGGAHDGMYSFPGGHLELLEEFNDCAKRELKEECGAQLVISEPQFFNIYNIIDKKLTKHYLTTVMLSEWKAGEPMNIEPHKCFGWEWFPIDQLPPNIYEGNRQAIEEYKLTA